MTTTKNNKFLTAKLSFLIAVVAFFLSASSYAGQYDATISTITPQPQLETGVPIPLSSLLSFTLPSLSAPNGVGPVDLVDAYGTSSNAQLTGLYDDAFDFYNPSWPARAAIVPSYADVYLTPQPGQSSISLTFSYQTAFGPGDGGIGYASYNQARFAFDIGPVSTQSLYVSYSPVPPLSATNQPRAIEASLLLSSTSPGANFVRLPFSIPDDVTTLAQAAQSLSLGYMGFNWEQKINVWPAPSLLLNPEGDPLTAPPEFNDPPPGGYQYCEARSVAGCTTAFPFYYDPSMLDGCAYLVGGICRIPIESSGDKILSFWDSPNDPLLPSGGYFYEFTTALVGEVHCATPNVGGCDSLGLTASAPLFSWSWIDTYNNVSGGVQTLGNTLPAAGGSGGIRIVAVNGMPVPEPPGLLLYMIGLVSLIGLRVHRVGLK